MYILDSRWEEIKNNWSRILMSLFPWRPPSNAPSPLCRLFHKTAWWEKGRWELLWADFSVLRCWDEFYFGNHLLWLLRTRGDKYIFFFFFLLRPWFWVVGHRSNHEPKFLIVFISFKVDRSSLMKVKFIPLKTDFW